ncbi:hypothetical protein RIF29_29746 [Crotalaria pallida]|uniref:Uncharacterized protein n=1 Tax=Crotalaria pallida TaxID=3830 RepID=A0AAN9EKA2_CROPI
MTFIAILADEKLVLASLEQYILLNSSDFQYPNADNMAVTRLVNLYCLLRGLGQMSYHFHYSREAEDIILHLINNDEWDLLYARIHTVSLKWFFQQESIIKSLCCQMLNLCRSCNLEGADMILGNNDQTINVWTLAESVSTEDNYGARIFWPTGLNSANFSVSLEVIFNSYVGKPYPKALEEASKQILFNTSIISVVNTIASKASSAGPALVDYDEKTSTAQTLTFVLWLNYFTIKRLLGWESVAKETKVTGKISWCRLIMEEMTVSLATPALASQSFIKSRTPAIHTHCIAETGLNTSVDEICV